MIRFKVGDTGGGGGGTVTGGNNGVTLNGANIQLGQLAAGAGASSFTADRFLYFGAFKFQFGGSAGNNLFKFDGNTGNFSIGTAAPSTKAIFEITSTDKGVLISRMTTVQRDLIPAPDTSLLIFNLTTNQYEWWDGAAWVSFSTTYTAGSGITLSAGVFKLGASSSASGPADFTEHRYVNLNGYLLRVFGTSSGAAGQLAIDGYTGITSVRGSGTDTVFVFGDSTKFAYLRANSIGTTYSDEKALALLNLTQASAGSQQMSPALRWRGYGWKTNAVAASQSVDFKAEVLPVQGAVSPTGLWRLGASINGTAYIDNLFTVGSDGEIESYGSYVIGKYVPSTINIVARIAASSSEANMGISIVPRGTGSLTAAVADNTNAGGNSRGQNSVDWQTATRTASNQVASGNFSVLGGGFQNRVSAYAGVVLGGNNNFVDGQNGTAGGANCRAASNYTFAIGYYAYSYIYGMQSRASGFHSVQGDAQASGLIVRRNQAGLATGDTSILYTDGAAGLLVPDGSTRFWTVQIWYNSFVTARAGTTTGVAVNDSFGGSDLLYVTKVAGVLTIIGGSTTLFFKSVGGMGTAGRTYTVGGSNNLLISIVAPTFAGGGTLTLKSVARIELVENA